MNSKELLDGISEGELAQMAMELLAQLEQNAKDNSADFGVQQKDLAKGFYSPAFSHEQYIRGKSDPGCYLQLPDGGVLPVHMVLGDEHGGQAQAYGAETQERTARGGVFDGTPHRRGGAAQGSGAGTTADEGFYEAESVLTAEQELSHSALPEKLSELFCRDARRYDGAFERY